MYLIDQEIAREIAREADIKPLEIQNLFWADNEEEAEIFEQKIRDKYSKKTGSSQIGRAMAVYSPLLYANKAITSYIQRTGDQSLRAVAPEVLTPEETALLAQRDLMLDDDEVLILIEQIRFQGTNVSHVPIDNSRDWIRIYSYADLRRSTQKIRDKKDRIAFTELVKIMKEILAQDAEKANEEKGKVKSEPSPNDELTDIERLEPIVTDPTKSANDQISNHKQTAIIQMLSIRNFILSKGLSHQDIADVTGFSLPYISRMLSGQIIPRLDTFMILCEAVGIPSIDIAKTIKRTTKG